MGSEMCIRDSEYTMTNELIGSREAAEILRMSPMTFNRRVRAGAIPVVQKMPGLRGAYVFSRPTIESIARRIGA